MTKKNIKLENLLAELSVNNITSIKVTPATEYTNAKVELSNAVIYVATHLKKSFLVYTVSNVEKRKPVTECLTAKEAISYIL